MAALPFFPKDIIMWGIKFEYQGEAQLCGIIYINKIQLVRSTVFSFSGRNW